MHLKQIGTSLVAIAALALGASATAAPITPFSTSFGTLTGATFGGTGIPNNAVAMNTALAGVTLGLTAHQRFVGSNLVNDGAGTFTAQTGLSMTAPSPADPFATWNFGFYIGGANAGQFAYRLYYDFDSGAGTAESAHGYAQLNAGVVGTAPAQGSWNLGMNFLATSGPWTLPPPSQTVVIGSFVAPAMAFDPNRAGQYTFALAAGTVDVTGAFIEGARSAIQVNVVPEPGSLALVGLALAGLGIASRRRQA